ncbi:MAG: response regulator [Verrucomicrobiota bacterium]
MKLLSMWNQRPAILVAEDNADDALILERTLRKVGIRNPIQIVRDGSEAIAYLKGSGPYHDRTAFPFPGVVITDLKMPKVNGFEVLKWLKNHPECSVIPVVVLTGSAIESDVVLAHQLHANCYLQKPTSADEFARMLQLLFNFWHMCKIPKLTSSVCAEDNPPDKK